MIPGELFPEPGDLELNAGLARSVLTVANTGDRPIQVGSHYHFAETNAALSFDRRVRGQRLDIAAAPRPLRAWANTGNHPGSLPRRAHGLWFPRRSDGSDILMARITRQLTPTCLVRRPETALASPTPT